MKGLQENQIIHDEILYEYNMEKKGKMTIVIFTVELIAKCWSDLWQVTKMKFILRNKETFN